MSELPHQEIDGAVESSLSRLLAAWVRGVERHARVVLWGFAVATIGLLAYTGLVLGINASHRALLSEDLEFWKEYNAFADVFPIVDEAIFVVVDGDSPIQARDATEALADRLGEDDRFTSVYVPGGGRYFERNALLYLTVEELEDLTDHLSSVQPWLAELSRDRSLANLARILEQGVEYSKDDPALLGNLISVFDSVSLAAQAVLEGRPRPISWDELLLRRSLPGDSTRRLILLETDFDYEQLLPAENAIAAIREAATEIGLDADESIRVRITGNVALNYEEMILVARGAILAIVGSLVLVGIILAAALGTTRLVVSTLVTLLVGLVWTAAFATLSVGHLNVISVAFAVLFIGLGVDFGIHVCMRYAEGLTAGRERGAALSDSVIHVGGSLVLCALTTAIGFYVFIPTDYRAVGELGLIAGTGMPISLLCSLTLLPALLATGEATAPKANRWAPRWFTQALVPLAFDHSRRVLVVAALLAVGALCALPLIRFDHNVARIRDPSSESAQTFEDLLTESGTSPWTMDAIASSLAEAQRVAADLEKRPFVERAVTLADYVPSDQEEKRGILVDLAFIVPEPTSIREPHDPPPLEEQIAALRTLIGIMRAQWIADAEAERGESAQRAALQLELFLTRLESLDTKQDAIDQLEDSLLGELPDQMRRLWGALDPGTVELDNLPSDLRRRMLAPDGRARIEILPSEDLGEQESIARFVDGVRADVPEATGSAVSILEWGRATVGSFQQALVAAVLAVSFVVWLLWRRFGDVFLVLMPLLLAALLTGATAGLLGISFNFVNVVVLPLLLGIGVDSGIHLVHRHREARELAHREVSGHELLGTSTAQAVFFSALTTMASFGSLALSGHGGISSLGKVLLIGVVITLACNLIVLPALLSARARR